MEIKSSNAKNNRYKVTWKELYQRINNIPKTKCYGVPRGGQVIAGLTGNAVDHIENADIIVDDIIDSGKTLDKYSIHNKPFIALFDKRKEFANVWIEFPWEKTEQDIEDTIIRQLEYIGEDCSREGLIDTPKRIIKSWNKLYGGYKENPKDILTAVFNQKYDEMVLLKDIEIYSTCEHHMLPFYGKAHIAYIPNKKVVGISKLARLMECFSRRMQIQERLCNQIVDSLEDNLKPLGSACVIEAQHFCMTSRGIQKQNSVMITSALRGEFKNNTNTRQEFMNLIKGGK